MHLFSLFKNSSLRRIPTSIWALGFVSLFMDISSELIHSLLPVFMVSTLGLSMTSVGMVEGIAEATALIVKIFSGTLSDYFRKRKLLALIGYGLAALTKPLFPLAQSVEAVLTARFADRIGKGIRGAPRDALIADIAAPEIRGACFGLRQALDTVGAFVGPLLAIAGMVLLANNIRTVLWIAVIPAVLSVLILIFGVQEPQSIEQTNEKNNSATEAKIKMADLFRDLTRVGQAYWQVVAIAGILTLARFSDAFLIIKAKETGLHIAFVPLVMVLMNIVYALAAYPAGVLSDRINRKKVLLMGVGFLIIADIVLGFSTNLWMLALGISFWGLHMAFTQGLFAAMVADSTPVALRGTAYGVFNVVSGMAMLAASVIAGLLWDRFGAPATFFAGAGFTVIALVGLLRLYAKPQI